MECIMPAIQDASTVGGVTRRGGNHQFRVHVPFRQLIDFFTHCYHYTVTTPVFVLCVRLYARLGGLGAVAVAIVVTDTGISSSRQFTLLRQA